MRNRPNTVQRLDATLSALESCLLSATDAEMRAARDSSRPVVRLIASALERHNTLNGSMSRQDPDRTAGRTRGAQPSGTRTPRPAMVLRGDNKPRGAVGALLKELAKEKSSKKRK